ncbi:MAG: toxin-activating lysine-acyltransferase [Rhizobiales bacterium]|nr:toxin-activating lysine-acyltransferase [Hyphomicrobiales bacterium]
MAKSESKQNGTDLKTKDKNGKAEAEATTKEETATIDPEVARKVAAVRAHVRESFGHVAMAMMMLPRYRHQTLADLQHLLLDPLIRDRVAIAYPAATDGVETQSELADVAGMAIWASVSDEVDEKIRDQIRSGTFPLRLKGDEWTSGETCWLIDIIAPDRKATANVIANFRQVVKEGTLRLHPIVSRLVDEEALEKMGAQKLADAN